MTVLKSGSASTLSIVAAVKSLLPKIRETLPPSLKILPLSDQSLFVKGGYFGRGSRGRHRRHPDERDDPDVSRQLAIDGHHRDIDPAGDPRIDHRACDGRPDLEYHDPWVVWRWPSAFWSTTLRSRSRTSTGISNKASRLKRRSWMGRVRSWTPAFVSASVHLHRLRADVLPARRGRFPVCPDGRSGGVRHDRLIHPIANPGSDPLQIPPPRSRRRARARSHGGTRLSGRPSLIEKSLREISARLRGWLRTRSHRLPWVADARARESAAFRLRVSGRRYSLVWPCSIPWEELLSVRRLG